MAIRLFRKKDEGDRKIKIPEGMWIKCDACSRSSTSPRWNET